MDEKKLRSFRFLIFVAASIAASAVFAEDAYFEQAKVYMTTWSMETLNRPTVDTIRTHPVLTMDSEDILFVTTLAKAVQLSVVDRSAEKAASTFTPRLVLDFWKQSKRMTYVSDGEQLCTEDLQHCIDVDEKFRKRFDPAMI